MLLSMLRLSCALKRTTRSSFISVSKNSTSTGMFICYDHPSWPTHLNSTTNTCTLFYCAQQHLSTDNGQCGRITARGGRRCILKDCRSRRSDSGAHVYLHMQTAIHGIWSPHGAREYRTITDVLKFNVHVRKRRHVRQLQPGRDHY